MAVNGTLADEWEAGANTNIPNFSIADTIYVGCRDASGVPISFANTHINSLQVCSLRPVAELVAWSAS
jgi:hypothetical protein